MKLKAPLVVLVLALVAAACSGSTEDSAADGASDTTSEMPSVGMGQTEGFSFGRPGDPSDADRTVRISQLDSFRFEPSGITVEMGEMVTFEVTNEGLAPHEFVLGDEMFQQEHESEMQEMGGQMMPDEPNAITVQPGETRSLTWTFTQAGILQFGCHVPGHFAAGMVGSVDVSA